MEFQQKLRIILWKKKLENICTNIYEFQKNFVLIKKSIKNFHNFDLHSFFYPPWFIGIRILTMRVRQRMWKVFCLSLENAALQKWKFCNTSKLHSAKLLFKVQLCKKQIRTASLLIDSKLLNIKCFCSKEISLKLEDYTTRQHFTIW